MASKYDISALPALPALDEKFQEKVNLLKNDLITDPTIIKTPVSLAEEYAELRFAKEELTRQLETINVTLEAYAQMLIASNDSKQIGWGLYGAMPTTLKLPSGESVRVQREPYFQVYDRDANRKWAIKNGLEGSLNLAWQTLNKHGKLALEKGEPEPDWVKTFVKAKIVYTHAKLGDL